jgi:hypothetical protein
MEISVALCRVICRIGTQEVLAFECRPHFYVCKTVSSYGWPFVIQGFAHRIRYGGVLVLLRRRNNSAGT